MAGINPVVPLSREDKTKALSDDGVHIEDISDINFRKRRGFNKLAEQKQAECVAKLKPFCNSCAMIDYSSFKQEHEMKNTILGKNGLPPVPLPDYKPVWKKYTDCMKRIGDNIKKIVKQGHGSVQPGSFSVTYANYKCGTCAGGHSIALPPSEE